MCWGNMRSGRRYDSARVVLTSQKIDKQTEQTKPRSMALCMSDCASAQLFLKLLQAIRACCNYDRHLSCTAVTACRHVLIFLQQEDSLFILQHIQLSSSMDCTC